MLATPAFTQQPRPPDDSQPPELLRAMPSGIRINSIAAYVEGDYMRIPYVSGTPGYLTQWLYMPGGTGEIGANFGRRTQFSADYQGGYSYNSLYPMLNGANHRIALNLRTDPARHTV